MSTVPSAYVNRSQLTKVVERAIRKVGKDAVQVNYNFDTDSTGDPALFFRIVLTDAASREDRLRESTERIESVLWDEIQPIENWGLFAYFNYRSKSEQEKLKDPRWA